MKKIMGVMLISVISYLHMSCMLLQGYVLEETFRIHGKLPSIAFSPDGKLLATGAMRIHLWDVASGECVWKSQTSSLIHYKQKRLFDL